LPTEIFNIIIVQCDLQKTQASIQNMCTLYIVVSIVFMITWCM